MTSTLQEDSAETPGRGSRRFLTILFSDVSDSSRLAEELEAEAFARLLEKFRIAARRIIPQHGGSVARLQGDGLLAIFGHQQSSEYNGRRAIEAALDLHEAVSRLSAGPGGGALGMHSGVHSGLVLLIEGDIERGRYDVVGEVPNTAARLCNMAARAEVLVSAQSLGPQANVFQVSTPFRMIVRGRNEPLDVMRVSGRAPIARRIDASARRGIVPMMGRQESLQQMLSLVQRGSPTGPAIVKLVGEPGVGKTRLLDELVGCIDNHQVFVMRGYCESYRGAEPFQPFLQALRTGLGIFAGNHGALTQATLLRTLASGDAEVVDSQLQAASDLLGLTASENPSARDGIQAIVDLASAVAGSRPILLVIDDWQWVDDASRQALQAMIARSRLMGIVVAERSANPDDDPSLSQATVLTVEPLDVGASLATVHAWLPDADAFLAQEIHRLSGGSPLFIEELCQLAAAHGDVAGAGVLQGGAWIDALVASRVSKLEPLDLRLLQSMSVLGSLVPGALLDAVCGPASFIRAQNVLVAEGYLLPSEGGHALRFRHVITRDAVYATVDLENRQALHLRAAQVMLAQAEDQPGRQPLEALAYHLSAAGRGEQSIPYAEAAGDRALRAMALDRARAHYLVALRALEALPVLSRAMTSRWCAIAEKLGQTCVFDPLDAADGTRWFLRAAELARDVGDLNATARAEYWLAYVNYGRGRPRLAVRHAEAALEGATKAQDSKLASQVKATLGQALASAGRPARAMALLREAVEEKRQQSRPGSGTAIGSAYSLGRLGYTLADLGRFDDAEECFDQALHLLGGSLHSVGASVRELICAARLWQGRWAEAEQLGFEGAAMALQCRSRYLTAMGKALGSCGGWALRQDTASLRELRDSTHWIEVRGGAVSTSLNYSWLVQASATCGDAVAMRQFAALLLQRARALDSHGLALGCRALAKVWMVDGQPARSWRYMILADRAAAQRESPREAAMNHLARGELHAMLSERSAAVEHLESAAEGFEAMKMPSYLPQVAELLSRV